MKTYFPSEQDALNARRWFHIDGNDQIVGRVASRVASILRGKENPRFVPFQDTGDFVIVTNVEKIRFSSDKAERKVYHQHTGFVGNLKSESAARLQARRPEEVLRRAVQGMLPRGPLGRAQLRKLKIYRGAEHPHAAQQPQQLSAEAAK